MDFKLGWEFNIEQIISFLSCQVSFTFVLIYHIYWGRGQCSLPCYGYPGLLRPDKVGWRVMVQSHLSLM